MIFEPTRTAALARLRTFVPRAGSLYAMQRNFDLPDHPHVSVLSPYVRHRILTEREILAAVLDMHGSEKADKFVAEVFWRTYWKGWLELRPDVWRWYQTDLTAAHNRLQTESGLRQNWEAACKGETGIDCFDYWANELAATGYLHNHARMWFASIWIFTLGLPWTLGADFFLRHLVDGDPASNTLSWRWVAGVQTKGKTYLATADNIAKFTGGRFNPKGLAKQAVALDAPDLPAPRDVPGQQRPAPDLRTGLLVTAEDLSPDFATRNLTISATATLDPDWSTGPFKTSAQVVAFRRAVVTGAAPDATHLMNVTSLVDWAKRMDLQQIVTPYVTVGPQSDVMHKATAELGENGIILCQIMRDYDRRAWPFATKGFFPFRKEIPALLAHL